MSTIAEKIDKLFRDAVHGENVGYPNGVEFVAADEEWAERVLWRNLIEGTPTVLVSEDAEVLLMPLHRSPIDRLRGRVPVNVAQRVHGRATPYATRSRLGRHPVREMRQLAHV